MNARALLTPRWIITTLLVIAAVGVMVRLGFWQLDRLEQRRAFNARVQAQIDSPALDLNTALPALDPLDLIDMEYRKVVLRGTYRPQEEVAVRNQIWENQPGYHLLTPVEIEGTNYVVMVNRGWVPLEENSPEHWAKYSQPGTVEIHGEIRQAQNNRRFGAPDPTLAPGETRMDAWNAINLFRIKDQVSGELLPVYILALPEGTQTQPPFRSYEPPDLSEGSHFGYALQWFSFAGVLAVGYPFFVRSQLREQKHEEQPYTSIS